MQKPHLHLRSSERKFFIKNASRWIYCTNASMIRGGETKKYRVGEISRYRKSSGNPFAVMILGWLCCASFPAAAQGDDLDAAIDNMSRLQTTDLLTPPPTETPAQQAANAHRKALFALGGIRPDDRRRVAGG